MPDITFAPGTVITNRNRLWRVDAHEGNVLVATSIDGGLAEQVKFYVPFEDICPGRLEPPSPGIVGHPSAQDLFLRAYRLSLLHGTAPLISLQRSRVIPKDYQLVPVVMALETPRVRMLIADDVGLGKTIEAGLIITELLARQMASRLLVIVPVNLREQWQEAPDYFFHIPARIISARHRREMERELPAGANPWEHYRYLITSVDYAKQPAIKNQILEQRWDIVVIDEAHQVAKPHQSGPDQRVRMDRWELAEAAVRGDFRRVCLQVTAGQDYFRRTFDLVKAVRGVCDLPVDAAILPYNVGQVEALLSAGVEHIGFGLDATCERVFRRVKRSNWERSIKLVEEAARRFPGHVAVHLIVGLGETEREMTEMIQRMHDLGVIVGLFAFTPLRGTAMQDQPPPPLDTYRRMQVARHLISHDLAALGDFVFSTEGRLVSFGQPDLAKLLADGLAFQTSGCPDCNRPFYNEGPGGPLYNYPRPLRPAEALRAVAELRVAGDCGG